jgi:uncharacterized protein (TIGR02594 family)
MSKLIDIASAEIGVKEIKGDQHNARILQYGQEAGFAFMKDDEIGWCSIFLNWVAMKANLPRSKDGRAISWVKVGEVVSDPQPGDVILCGKGGDITQIYHVGLFTGYSQDKKMVFCLGGNQSDSVSISKMLATEVAGFRRIEPLSVDIIQAPVGDIKDLKKDTVITPKPTPAPPKPVFKIADERLTPNEKGESVLELQKALKYLGFDCKPTSVYDELTTTAVRMLQAKGNLRVNGKLNGETREYLLTLLA